MQAATAVRIWRLPLGAGACPGHGWRLFCHSHGAGVLCGGRHHYKERLPNLGGNAVPQTPSCQSEKQCASCMSLQGHGISVHFSPNECFWLAVDCMLVSTCCICRLSSSGIHMPVQDRSKPVRQQQMANVPSTPLSFGSKLLFKECIPVKSPFTVVCRGMLYKRTNLLMQMQLNGQQILFHRSACWQLWRFWWDPWDFRPS